ncbi:hypothetical protein D3868_31970 (plasmid) [Azospirillum brasilense]|uniref:Uncharacterized protein n=1 Tax=Azospirillum brasilense TaxID=192 RepID=A0A4D8R3A0_AZOBR|nr:hypothetical protein D3868_31970 [Azospirillum brasilense]
MRLHPAQRVGKAVVQRGQPLVEVGKRLRQNGVGAGRGLRCPLAPALLHALGEGADFGAVDGGLEVAFGMDDFVERVDGSGSGGTPNSAAACAAAWAVLSKRRSKR